MTVILLVFQADSKHEEITNVYMGLVVCRVESHLYAPDQILDFIKDIEVDLQAARDALKAGGNPGKRCTFCLFVNNFSGAMSILMDLPYCLVCPTSYIKDVKLDHFDTRNNPAGHTCIIVYAVPPYSSAMINPKSAPTMPGATSSAPWGSVQ